MPSQPVPLDPWPALFRVTRSRIQVFTPGGDSDRPRHEGEGQVEVLAQGDAIIWQERGRWTAGDLAGIAFHNATAWRRRDPNSPLELRHLRRGAEHPALLVELVPALGEWRSREPHLCGPDRYSARLIRAAHELCLEWTVASPTDPYLLRWTARVT